MKALGLLSFAAVVSVAMVLTVTKVNARSEWAPELSQQSRCMRLADPRNIDTLAAQVVSMGAQRMKEIADSASEAVKASMNAFEGVFYSFYTSSRDIAFYAVLFDPAQPAYRLQLAEARYAAAMRGEGHVEPSEARAALRDAECTIELGESAVDSGLVHRATVLADRIRQALRAQPGHPPGSVPQ